MNFIHPTAVVESNVTLGQNNYIGPFCRINNAHIGDNNRFEAFVSIGTPAEHKLAQSSHPVEIGNGNVFREFVSVNCGTTQRTKIQNYCYLMAYAHVAHDCVIEDSVTMTNSVLLGGHVYVMEGANLGLGCVVHQRQVIGAYAMIGMGAVITKGADVRPGEMWYGNPAEYQKANEVGLRRAEIADLDSLDKDYERIREQWSRY